MSYVVKYNRNNHQTARFRQEDSHTTQQYTILNRTPDQTVIKQLILLVNSLMRNKVANLALKPSVQELLSQPMDEALDNVQSDKCIFAETLDSW